MKRITIGTYQLGYQNVDLLATPKDIGGEFYLCPDEKSPPRMIVGLDYPSWHECLAVLLHETIELSMCLNNLRFQRSGKLSGDLADYTFMFDHSQFSHVCSTSALFLSQSIPDLAKTYKKHHQ